MCYAHPADRTRTNPADVSALGVLRAMVAHYVHEGRKLDRLGDFATQTERDRHAGMSDMLVHVAGILYGEDADTATERVADMIEDVALGMAD